jgi:predicted DNA-binding antitoxin AbrB/MazE fold protein
MGQQVEAIYEGGVLRPLEPLALVESQLVSVTIVDSEDAADSDRKFLEAVRAEASKLHNLPALEDVQRAMSKIPGSLAEDLAAERGDR